MDGDESPSGRRAPGILRHRNSPTIPVNLIRFLGIPSISLNQLSRSVTAELTRNMPKFWGPYNPTASLFDRAACFAGSFNRKNQLRWRG
jgi:hypothetical protein